MSADLTPPRDYASWSLDRRNAWWVASMKRYTPPLRPEPKKPDPPDPRVEAARLREVERIARFLSDWRFEPRSQWIKTKPLPWTSEQWREVRGLNLTVHRGAQPD